MGPERCCCFFFFFSPVCLHFRVVQLHLIYSPLHLFWHGQFPAPLFTNYHFGSLLPIHTPYLFWPWATNPLSSQIYLALPTWVRSANFIHACVHSSARSWMGMLTNTDPCGYSTKLLFPQCHVILCMIHYPLFFVFSISVNDRPMQLLTERLILIYVARTISWDIASHALVQTRYFISTVITLILLFYFNKAKIESTCIWT